MAFIKLDAYATSITVLSGAASGELVSLANGSLSALTDGTHGIILDNRAAGNGSQRLYADFEIITGTLGGAPTVGNKLSLYAFTSLDGTNYEIAPAAGANTPDSSKKVGDAAIETTGTSQRVHIWRFALVPALYKFQLLNNSGAAFPATGSSVIAYPYYMQVA